MVIATVCLLTGLMLPALARAKIKSPAAGCLSALRQMQLGATMYRDDNNDFLLPNPSGSVTNSWVQGTENWHTFSANTNVFYYKVGLLWPYINGDISVYRCPADFKPSDNGYRLRSRSMNGQMSPSPTFPPPALRIYYKGSNLTCPTPANAFVFCDESMYTLNDGELQISLGAPGYPDTPAAYHAGGCGFSFADNHAEIHRWQGANLTAVPYTYGVVKSSGNSWPTTVNDSDWRWFIVHATCPTN